MTPPKAASPARPRKAAAAPAVVTPPEGGLLSKQISSAIRNGVGVVVGAGIAWAAKHGLHIDKASADAWLLPLSIGGYSGGVRVLEHRWPSLGRLLGVPRS